MASSNPMATQMTLDKLTDHKTKLKVMNLGKVLVGGGAQEREEEIKGERKTNQHYTQMRNHQRTIKLNKIRKGEWWSGAKGQSTSVACHVRNDSRDSTKY